MDPVASCQDATNAVKGLFRGLGLYLSMLLVCGTVRGTRRAYEAPSVAMWGRHVASMQSSDLWGLLRF